VRLITPEDRKITLNHPIEWQRDGNGLEPVHTARLCSETAPTLVETATGASVICGYSPSTVSILPAARPPPATASGANSRTWRGAGTSSEPTSSGSSARACRTAGTADTSDRSRRRRCGRSRGRCGRSI